MDRFEQGFVACVAHVGQRIGQVMWSVHQVFEESPTNISDAFLRTDLRKRPCGFLCDQFHAIEQRNREEPDRFLPSCARMKFGSNNSKVLVGVCGQDEKIFPVAIVERIEVHQSIEQLVTTSSICRCRFIHWVQFHSDALGRLNLRHSKVSRTAIERPQNPSTSMNVLPDSRHFQVLILRSPAGDESPVVISC